MCALHQIPSESMTIPKHVAIIMDGNGRWAEQHGKRRVFGHKEGVKAVRRAVHCAVQQGINVLTLYAFSSENWNRPTQEVSALMDLFILVLDREVKNLHKRNIKLSIIGNTKQFSQKLQKRIKGSELMTKDNTGLQLNIAANYGGRWDITQAAQKLVEEVVVGNLKLSEISESYFGKFVCLNELAPVDLVIRTGGEQRISNYLLWQIAYAELFFSEILWPDFNEQAFMEAIKEFSRRERRFGGV